MSTGLVKTLIDKEKCMIDGKEAYRLFFFDEQTGYTLKVISYVATKDVHLAQPETQVAPSTNPNVEELENAVQ